MRFVLLATAIACATPSSSPTTIPDVLVLGKIHTLDPARPTVEALVIRDGKLACVGSQDACSHKAVAPKIVDLREGSAIPGLADAHGHILGYGRSLVNVSCLGLGSEAACVERVAERARKTPKGRWIRGRGWDQNRWPGAKFPTEKLLSERVPDHPVVLERIDGHAEWVNAKALEICGITEATRDPPGGKIERYPDGRPSGIVIDNAESLVDEKVPPLDAAEIEEALLAAMRKLVAVGLTSVHDAGVDARTLEVMRKLAAEDRLPIHVYAMLDGQQPMKDLEAQMALWKKTPEVGRLTVRAVKMYADGAMGSRGAVMFDPYSDDPANRGLFVTPPDELRRRVLAVALAGYQPAVHAIGDRGCASTLHAFSERVARPLRPRVEHLQVLLARDVPLLKSSGAIASMQPTHATSDGPWAEARLGHGTARQKGAYAWRQVLDAGVPLACGSDFPVEDVDPLRGLYSAETRKGPGLPDGGWMPEQRMTRLEAVRCFTAGAAYAEFAEQRRGVLRVGMDADLTAFDRDVMWVPVAELTKLRVTHTFVGGRDELNERAAR
jgi:predicted amidohydrolase YtcJ